MTRCQKSHADLILDGVAYRFATSHEALDTYHRLAGLRGAVWTAAGRRRWSLGHPPAAAAAAPHQVETHRLPEEEAPV